MKYMLALVLVMVLSIFSTPAQACEISKNGLTQEEYQTLVVECETMKKDRISGNATNTQEQTEQILQQYSAYGKYAKDIAEAVGIMAKELGMAVDEFMQTSTGKLVAILLIWKVAGETLYALMIGLLILFVATKMYAKVVKNLMLKSVEVVEVKNMFGKTKEVLVSKYKGWKEMEYQDGNGGIFILATVIYVASLITSAILII